MTDNNAISDITKKIFTVKEVRNEYANHCGGGQLDKILEMERVFDCFSYDALQQACFEGHINIVKHLHKKYKSGISIPNARDIVAQLCIDNKNYEIIQFLLEEWNPEIGTALRRNRAFTNRGGSYSNDHLLLLLNKYPDIFNLNYNTFTKNGVFGVACKNGWNDVVVLMIDSFARALNDYLENEDSRECIELMCKRGWTDIMIRVVNKISDRMTAKHVIDQVQRCCITHANDSVLTTFVTHFNPEIEPDVYDYILINILHHRKKDGCYTLSYYSSSHIAAYIRRNHGSIKTHTLQLVFDFTCRKFIEPPRYDGRIIRMDDVVGTLLASLVATSYDRLDTSLISNGIIDAMIKYGETEDIKFVIQTFGMDRSITVLVKSSWSNWDRVLVLMKNFEEKIDKREILAFAVAQICMDTRNNSEIYMNDIPKTKHIISTYLDHVDPLFASDLCDFDSDILYQLISKDDLKKWIDRHMDEYINDIVEKLDPDNENTAYVLADYNANEDSDFDQSTFDW